MQQQLRGSRNLGAHTILVEALAQELGFPVPNLDECSAFASGDFQQELAAARQQVHGGHSHVSGNSGGTASLASGGTDVHQCTAGSDASGRTVQQLRAATESAVERALGVEQYEVQHTNAACCPVLRFSLFDHMQCVREPGQTPLAPMQSQQVAAW